MTYPFTPLTKTKNDWPPVLPADPDLLRFTHMNLENRRYRQCDILSFDLFDTVLFRYVERPAHLFYFVGLAAEARTGIPPHRFLKYRILAERICRLYVRFLSSKEDILITDIYRMLGRISRMDEQLLAFLSSEEMRQETRLIYPNAEALEVLKSISVRNDKKIVFTSDMYLPFEFIYSILDKFGIIQSEEQLYLSSAIGKRKKSGNLFKYLLAKENTNMAPEKLLHVGDNYGHDYEVPSRLGISAVHYRRETPRTPWLPSIGNSDVSGGLIREVSKRTYLTSKNGVEEESLGVLGAYVGGPVLFSYVHWLLNQAVRRNIKTLYFMARDGQILIRIAQLLRGRYSLDIDLKYLYASRHSWLLPSILDYNQISEESKFFVFSKNLTLNRLLYRFKLEDVQADWLTEKIQNTGLQPDENITLLNLKKAKKLSTDREVIEQIRAIGDKEFKSLSGYLRQEGLFDDTAYALVDVGWRGSLPQALRRMLIKNGVREKGFTVFFVDQYGSTAYQDVDGYRSFLAETDNQYSPIRGEMEALMEVLAAATHESTYGFEEVDGRFQPVFIKEDLGEVNRWGLGKMQDIMVSFADNLICQPCFEEIPVASIYENSLENFYAFLNNPTQQMAEKISRFPYTVQQVKNENEEYEIICAPYRLRDFLTLLRNFNVVRPNDLWIQGSLTLTESAPLRLLFGAFYRFISSAPIRRVEQLVKNLMTN